MLSARSSREEAAEVPLRESLRAPSFAAALRPWDGMDEQEDSRVINVVVTADEDVYVERKRRIATVAGPEHHPWSARVGAMRSRIRSASSSSYLLVMAPHGRARA